MENWVSNFLLKSSECRVKWNKISILLKIVIIVSMINKVYVNLIEINLKDKAKGDINV